MKTKLQLSKNVTMNKPDEKRQGMKVRRVVTGHDAKGRAVFVRDEQVDGTPIPGIGELAFLWNMSTEELNALTAKLQAERCLLDQCFGHPEPSSRVAPAQKQTIALHDLSIACLTRPLPSTGLARQRSQSANFG